MQTTVYEGYFDNGRFYTSGKVVNIPELRRVVITILDDVQNADTQTNVQKKTDLLSPPTLKTRGWKFSREEANER